MNVRSPGFFVSANALSFSCTNIVKESLMVPCLFWESSEMSLWMFRVSCSHIEYDEKAGKFSLRNYQEGKADNLQSILLTALHIEEYEIRPCSSESQNHRIS